MIRRIHNDTADECIVMSDNLFYFQEKTGSFCCKFGAQVMPDARLKLHCEYTLWMQEPIRAQTKR